MAPNRPFLSSLLASFTARSATRGAVTSSTSTLSSSSSSAATAQLQASHQTPHTSATAALQSARSLNTKSGQTTAGTATVAIQTSSFTQARHHSASPLSRSPGPAATSTRNGPPFGSPITATSKTRRGSDSSNEGFRDLLGAEKWYIGGRTAAGDEKFYKLSMVKRQRSIDRLSIDRMSL